MSGTGPHGTPYAELVTLIRTTARQRRSKREGGQPGRTQEESRDQAWQEEKHQGHSHHWKGPEPSRGSGI